MSDFLTLTLKSDPGHLIDAGSLNPAALAALSVAEIQRLPLGRQRVGDLFEVADGGRERLALIGDTHRLRNLGAGLAQGTIAVYGDAGPYLGLEMRGGRIEVAGSAGPCAGAGARGGLITIAGDAGDRLGGALPGAVAGMNGATILVRGHAGDRVGDRMRRGLIVVGSAGDLAAFRAVAGTVVVEGACGRWPGFGLKRASLILGGPAELLPTYADCGSHDLAYLNLLWRSLGRLGHRVAQPVARARRWAGDLATGGKGEILQF